MFQAILRNVLVLLVLAANSVTFAFAAENRVALVIGNSAYRHATELDNPKNDAADIAVAAEKLGFKVIKGLDLDKSGMDRTIRQFAEALRGATVGMFFYAGHGLQVSGRNYLVPIDAELKTAEALDFEMVGLDVIQRVMENASETNVLFIDACRDNPLSRNLARAMGTRSGAVGRGLTAQEAGAGTLISFSTQPGNVALDGTGTRNSPYAGALAKHIATQGKDLPAVLVQVRRDVMATTGKRQIPWEHSALTAEVMLAPGAPVQTAVTTAPKPDVSERSANDSTRSEPKTTTMPTVPVQAVPVQAVPVQTVESKTAEMGAKPEPARQTTIKIIKPGIVKITKSDHSQHVYDEANRFTKYPFSDSIELPPGRYRLLDNDKEHISTALFDINAGETVDINQIAGFVAVEGTKHSQHLYDETGTNRLTKYAFSDGVHLPPGRYHLADNDKEHISTALFDIKAGQTVDIKQISGFVAVEGTKHSQHLYDETGTNRLTKYAFSDGVHLPPGRYRLADNDKEHISTALFDIKAGETVDIKQISGFVAVEGTKHNQHLYDETGTKRLTKYSFSDGVHLPPGRYRLADNDKEHISTVPFAIKAGETVDIKQISGVLTLKGAKHAQHIYDETGKRLTKYPFDDEVRLPPGRYRLVDNTTERVTVEALEIKLGEETVIDFGG
jgi:predicted RecA/RadA family phage recombinase